MFTKDGEYTIDLPQLHEERLNKRFLTESPASYFGKETSSEDLLCSACFQKQLPLIKSLENLEDRITFEERSQLCSICTSKLKAFLNDKHRQIILHQSYQWHFSNGLVRL